MIKIKKIYKKNFFFNKVQYFFFNKIGYFFINILALITEKDPLLPLEFGELSFSIDYDEERLFLEPDVERANDFERMKSGLIDPLNYITKWGDFDTNVNEDKIIKEFARRKELFNTLFSSNEETNNNNANKNFNEISVFNIITY